MQPETLFETGFILITSAVLATVAAGCVFWIRWFKGWGKRNLCGDRSPELITRLPQPRPRWTVFDFFIMFGLMIFVGSLLHESAKPNAEPTPALHADLAARGVTDTMGFAFPVEDPAFASLEAKRVALERFADAFIRP